MEIFLFFLIGSFLSGIIFSETDPKWLYLGAAVVVMIITFIYFNFNSFI